MYNKNHKEELHRLVDSKSPLIFIRHFDFKMIDSMIDAIASENRANVYEYHQALGSIDFKTKKPHEYQDISEDPINISSSLESFLKHYREEGYNGEIYFVLKDIYKELENPNTLSLFRRIAEDTQNRIGYHVCIFVISTRLKVPLEIEHYINLFEIEPPGRGDIIEIIDGFAKTHGISIDSRVKSELAISLKGVSSFQINRVLTLAYQNNGNISISDKKLILDEKEQFIKKSGLLELVRVNEKIKIEDIGGLENLISWLKVKAHIIKNLREAQEFGVDIPKGVMIVGMPGCGKSLSAKASAALFEIPLIRLDIGRLMGKYIGESEENMQRALKLTEAIHPCVLWIDEIEKAFAGIGTGAGHEVTTRLFGQFLTWMQEKSNNVFVVATANDLRFIPPEFLRKGRFDEIFFVDLPNVLEREEIFKLHLKKRKKYTENLDLATLAKSSDGFNGADIESAINRCVERLFVERTDSLRTEDLLEILKETKSISKTLKDKIESLRSSILKMDVRNASAFHISSIEALFNKSSQNLAKRIRDIVDSGFVEIVSHVNRREMERHFCFKKTTTKFELAQFRKKYDNDIEEISGLVRKSYKNALSDIKYDMQESSYYVLKKHFDSVLLNKIASDPKNYIDEFDVDYHYGDGVYEAIVNIQINVIKKIVSSIYATIKKDSQDIDTMLNIKDDERIDS